MVSMTADRPVTAVDPRQVPDPRVREQLRHSYDGMVDEPVAVPPWALHGLPAEGRATDNGT